MFKVTDCDLKPRTRQASEIYAIAINIRIMRTFVSVRQQIYSRQSISAELEAIKTKLLLLERSDEDNLEAINDLSEDIRREIDNIYKQLQRSLQKSHRQDPGRSVSRPDSKRLPGSTPTLQTMPAEGRRRSGEEFVEDFEGVDIDG